MIENILKNLPQEKPFSIAIIGEHWNTATINIFQSLLPNNIDAQFISSIPTDPVFPFYPSSIFVYHSIPQLKQFLFEEDLLKVLWLAKRNPSEEYIYLGLGAENRASATAASAVKLQMAGLQNIKINNHHFSTIGFINTTHFDAYIIDQNIWPFLDDQKLKANKKIVVSTARNNDIAQAIKLALNTSNAVTFQNFESQFEDKQTDAIKFLDDVYGSNNSKLVHRTEFDQLFE